MEFQDVLRRVVRRRMFPFARFDIGGLEHIPSDGPIIVAANHRSYFDPVPLFLALYASGRLPRILAKQELFDHLTTRMFMRALGAIPVDRRGPNPAAALTAAGAALGAGQCVVILPEGTIPPPERALRARSGVARLVADSGAPLVPLALSGTELVWPHHHGPHILRVRRPPVVRVRVGPPLEGLGGDPSHRGAWADTTRIMAAIGDLLERG